jgi:hypothetical protein
MEIPSLRVAQHFIDEVYRVLDLTVGVRLPPFDDNCCTERVRKKFVGVKGLDSSPFTS